MIKNERVKRILEFIETMRVCDVTHISRMFYKENKFAVQDAQLKLSRLVKEKTLKRIRSDINSRYIYFFDKEPSQIHHKMLITELYVILAQEVGENNIEITMEYTGIDGIRPDAFIKIIKDRRIYYFFIESHVSNNPVDFQKYENSYISKSYTSAFPEGIFPTVLIITQKKVTPPKSQLKYMVFDESLNDLVRRIF